MTLIDWLIVYSLKSHSGLFHLWWGIALHGFFSSPGLKAQVRHYDELTTVCKLFTFSSSPPEPID